MLDPCDTIFALSSGRPPAAIAVVRVSGPQAADAIRTLAGRLPEPRRAALLRLMSASAEDAPPEPIDDALVLWFPGPRSETGEDTAEFQLHGGPAVIAAMLSALGRIDGLRPAEPGEFTRRAFENGKLDLTRVEGLADLIGAETEAQRRQAFRQLKGLLGDRAEQWRRRLTEALALVEAAIDFPDEGIESAHVVGPALAIAKELEQGVRTLLTDANRGERLRDGLTVAIAGPVNVGKSSILNRLANRPAAIVSPHAGTTRDVIEVHLDLAGFPVTVIDTAGLRDTVDPVEEEGVRRARARARDADLVLWVMDGTLTSPLLPPPDLFAEGMPPVWVVVNKIDLVRDGTQDEQALGPRSLKRRRAGAIGGEADLSTVGVPFQTSREADGGGTPPLQEGQDVSRETRHERDSEDGTRSYRISAETGDSFDDLVSGISGFAREFFSSGTESPLITRQRHRAALTECAGALSRALAEGAGLGREDIIAEELRLASRALGRLVGKVDVESVLDVIFRDFCIGK
jgi:tRNA modification GTPase